MSTSQCNSTSGGGTPPPPPPLPATTPTATTNSTTIRFRVPSKKPPDTPKSNFEISTPAMSSSSSEEESSSGGEEEEEEEEEGGQGARRRRRREQSFSNSSPSSSEEQCKHLSSVNKRRRTSTSPTNHAGTPASSVASPSASSVASSSRNVFITPRPPRQPTATSTWSSSSAESTPEQRRPHSRASWDIPESPPGISSILGGSGTSQLSEILRRRRQRLEGRVNDNDDELTDTVLSVVWANGHLGAAYYSLDTAEVMLLPDTVESAPDYWVLKSLFNQVMPRYVIVNSRQDERMINVLQELTGNKIEAEEEENDNEDEEINNNNNRDRLVPSEAHSSQLFLLNGKDFSPDLCRSRILAMKIPYEPKDNSPEEHDLFVSSLIPLRSEIMVRAAGALLKFLDKSAIELFQMEVIDGQVPVLDVKTCTMDEMCLVDESAWQSLQIFSTDIHPSSVKQGNQSSSKEGISIFSVMNLCATVQGSRFLRLMLLRPCRSVSMLQRRYDVIDFCRNPLHAEFVKSATDCLKSIKSLPKLLYKLSLLHLTVGEWKDLYQSVYHCLLLSEICMAQYRQFPEIDLLKEICLDANVNLLREISREMNRVIDFEESKKVNRLVPRNGINPELDIRRQQHTSLPEIMELVSREDMDTLPEYARECCVVYIPEVGYLLGISLWGPDLSSEELELPDLEFKFATADLAYYKSARTKDLDLVLGDCQVSILEMETSIMIILAESIINKSPVLFKIGQLVTELDCLLAMALYADRNGLVRPNIVPGDQPLEIIDGRHPLAELTGDFVPNSTQFNGEERVTIITGPNASGKSVYLKQVGVIVIMALAGSFVPAAYAQIPTYDRICTRIHATESLSTGFSSFMIDLSQISLALRTTTKQSLVIVDEFGKGTADADGLSLLVATIEDFLERKQNCPTIFLSTHYYSVVNYLNPTPLLKQQTMKFIHKDDGDGRPEVTYLFILVDGVCESSFASIVATVAGIPQELIDRSKVVEEAVKYQIGAEKLVPVKSKEMVERENVMSDIADLFLSTTIDDIDPLESLKLIQQTVSDAMN